MCGVCGVCHVWGVCGVCHVWGVCGVCGECLDGWVGGLVLRGAWLTRSADCWVEGYLG